MKILPEIFNCSDAKTLSYKFCGKNIVCLAFCTRNVKTVFTETSTSQTSLKSTIEDCFFRKPVLIWNQIRTQISRLTYKTIKFRFKIYFRSIFNENPPMSTYVRTSWKKIKFTRRSINFFVKSIWF